MVKDTLNSVFENIKERTTNPFLGTLAIVWLIKNWTLVYSLFYFDGGFKLQQRLDYISKYFSEKSFLLNMIYVILITLAVLIITYILLALSRLISDSYERLILPLVSKWTDKNSIVLKSKYQELELVVKQLEARLEEERIAKVNAQNERDSLVKKQNDSLNTASADETALRRVGNYFLNANLVKQVSSIITDIQNNESVPNGDSVVTKLLNEDMIVFRSSDSNDLKYTYYNFTDFGKQFLRYWNNMFSE